MPPRRTATTSDRALNAAAIAAAEAQDPPPEAADVADNGEADMDVDWKDADGINLTWKLITTIEDTVFIRDSLFPPVGAPKLSGGKPKSDYQYQLAQMLFAEHPKYKDVFLNAVTAEEKKQWYVKIKNWLEQEVDQTSPITGPNSNLPRKNQQIEGRA
ncbi:hypothetical protein B0H14DRAFT_3508919 [Mycena olivaceomarginata]|nr:hypothetical protein B0H14DRAFT_3508919 [Mycena olivaceomarginata]